MKIESRESRSPNSGPDGPRLAVYCEPCKERRATESPAKHFPGGTPMCDVCFGGRPKKSKEENIMPARKGIDLEKLKQLHGQGMGSTAIGREVGISGGTVKYHLDKLGLKANPRGGTGAARQWGGKPAPAATRSAIASAGGDFKPRRKAGASRPADGAGRVTLSVDETFLDTVWVALDLAKKAQLINRFCEG